MARFCPFGLFALVLCLVACVCAHGEVSADDAKKAVNDAQRYANKVLTDLKSEVRNAIDLRNNVNKYKRETEEAATEAEKAAQGNAEAVAIAETAKNASTEFLNRFPNISELASKYVDNMTRLRTRAHELNERAISELFVNSWDEGDYTEKKKDADAIKTDAVALENEFKAATKPYSDMVDTQKKMADLVKTAQRARYHVDVIAAVAKIESLLKSADTDIKHTEQKKTEIINTEQEMKNLSDNSPENLMNYLSRLHFLVEDLASSMSRELEKSKEANARILKIKPQADETLVNFKAETDVEEAERKASVAHSAVKDAEKEVEEIKKALKSATKSATDALDHRNAALNAINQNEKKTDAAHDSGKTNSQDSANTHQPVKDTTESLAGTETKQDKIPSPVKPVSVKPKEDSKENDAGIKDKKPIITTQDQPVGEQPADETTESPEGNETEKPTITNSEQPVSGGPQPTKPFSSDSTMTVSVPLLLAMVACAALH